MSGNSPGNASDRLAVLMGRGRSGTSWLGAILNSHTGVAYRYEPFGRMRESLQGFRERILEGKVDSGLIERLYRFLLKSDPLLDKPPFAPKNYRSRFGLWKKQLWPVCRAVRPLAPLFKWLYSPVEPPLKLIFKDVDKENLLMPLIAKGGLKGVYIIRHPCASIWSTKTGIERGVMFPSQERFLADSLPRYAPKLAGRYVGRLNDLTPSELWALTWRVWVEQALDVAKAYPERLGVVFYEKMCLDPVGESEAVFKHLGLEMHETTRLFLECSCGQSDPAKHGEVLRDDYFSVFKNPAKSMSKWRTTMPQEEQSRVIGIVGDSEFYQMGIDQGAWKN